MTTNETEKHSSTRAPRRWRRLLLWGLLGVVVAVVVAVVWGGWRFNELVESGKDAGERYERLTQDYTFTPPEDGPTAERLEAMLAARDAMIEAWPATARAAGKQLLEGGEANRTAMALVALGLAPGVRAAVEAHASALEEAEMSPLEYRWLLGVLVAEALDHPDRHPVAGQYRTVGEAMDRLGEEREAPSMLSDRLKEANDAAPVPDPALVDRLEGAPAVVYAADLLTLTVRPRREAEETQP